MRILLYCFRPHLEPLEPRLPPGDIVFRAAVTVTRLTSSVPSTASTSAAHLLIHTPPPSGPFVPFPFAPHDTVSSEQSYSPIAATRPAETWQTDAAPKPSRVAAAQPPTESGTGFAPNVTSPAVVTSGAHSFTPMIAIENSDTALLQAIASLPPPETQSAGVQALFDLSHPSTGPFPSNRFTVPDETQNTGRRVDLPLPDCVQRPSDCRDLADINTLDGFNLQPRLTIPFDGPIDVYSVTSATVFLVSLGSTLPHGGDPRGTVIGINQVLWDPATFTLVAESDELLAQHTRYALIVTRGVLDEAGDPVEATKSFRNFRDELKGDLEFYRDELLDSLAVAEKLGVPEKEIVTASVFTTESTTAVLEKIRDQLLANPPEPADFLLAPDGSRTVFNLADVTRVQWQYQTRTSPPGFNPQNLDLSLLQLVPGAVGQLAYGKFLSPNYETPDRIIPQVGTLTGEPAVQSYNEIYFNLILPSGERPEAGWPVAIFGHGTPSDKNTVPLQTAAKMAEYGVATLAINAVGHGFGPLGTLTVSQVGGDPVTFPDGGRGVDVNGDRYIDGSEGVTAAGGSIIYDRDGKRQTVVDLMQLVRVIEVGMDVDGDKLPDLDAGRVSYFGRSYGGIYGTVFMGVEPNASAGVLIVGGGALINSRRLSAINRPSVGALLQFRTPSLLNPPGLSHIGGLAVGPPYFNENIPLRNRPPVVNTVAGAMAVQEFFDRHEWVGLAGDPLGYAPHLRKAPLPGMPEKSVLVQFGLGDQNVPNPATTAILRAGDLADRAIYYRHDRAFAEEPRRPRNSHSFQIAVTDLTMRDIALGAQDQIGAFFASGGKDVIHPEPKRFFEVPIQGSLPEEMNYLV